MAATSTSTPTPTQRLHFLQVTPTHYVPLTLTVQPRPSDADRGDGRRPELTAAADWFSEPHLQGFLAALYPELRHILREHAIARRTAALAAARAATPAALAAAAAPPPPVAIAGDAEHPGLGIEVGAGADDDAARRARQALLARYGHRWWWWRVTVTPLAARGLQGRSGGHAVLLRRVDAAYARQPLRRLPLTLHATVCIGRVPAHARLPTQPRPAYAGAGRAAAAAADHAAAALTNRLALDPFLPPSGGPMGPTGRPPTLAAKAAANATPAAAPPKPVDPEDALFPEDL